jgi:preprotein translocase subunit SecE
MIMDKVKLYAKQALQFLSDAKAELKKVTWPTKQQTLASTAVVMVIVLIMSIYLGIIDFVLAKVVKLILG